MDSDDLFVVERLDNRRSLCLSTLARATVTESEASHLGGDRGLFIYEVDESLGASWGAGISKGRVRGGGLATD